MLRWDVVTAIWFVGVVLVLAVFGRGVGVGRCTVLWAGVWVGFDVGLCVFLWGYCLCCFCESVFGCVGWLVFEVCSVG